MKNNQTQIEQIIVSIILRSPEKLLSTQLESRWFVKFRRVIETMQKMAGSGIAIDAMSLADNAGGLALSDIVGWQRDGVGAPANYERYLASLKEIYIANGLKDSLTNALASIENGDPASTAMADLLSKTVEIQNSDGKNFNYTAKDAMLKFVGNLEEVFDAKDTGGTGLNIVLPALDEVLGGLHPSDLVVVGARPGVGKTAFALSCILRVCRQGKRVGFFSTEMPVVQVMGRLASMVSGISAKKLRDANLDDSDWARLTAATNEIQNFKLMICDKPSITSGEIAMQSRAWSMADGLDFIAIDYLTRIKPDKPTGNSNIDVGDIATSIKNVARTLEIPLMLLAQLNRGSTNRTDKRPKMSDLRDSGVVEQEADSILLLHRDFENGFSGDDAAEVIVDKNRHGEVATVLCRYVPYLTRWDSFEKDTH